MKLRTAVPAAIALVALVLVVVIAVRPGAVEEPIQAIMRAAMGGGAGAPAESTRAPEPAPSAAAPEAVPAPAEKPKSVRTYGVAVPKAKPPGAVRHLQHGELL